ncbi:MAG TPA: hypothetical protein VIL31_05845 [Cyclobacteriaceae bacterium]|jgi:hypothetical protein|nr:hypothetical protein [Cyclobacteriaceae bacterium]
MDRTAHSLEIVIVRLALVSAWLVLSPTSHGQDVEGIGQQEPIKISGMLAANLSFFDAQGRPSNREQFTWYLTGNPTLEIYGITLPFSFTVSEQQRAFRQPFNQFGVSPYYRWAKAHIGYRNVVFSPFTLGGHTIAGGGIELTPGKFRFGVMHGRLLKAVQAIGNPEGSFVAAPSFRRTGTALKVGYGTEENFVDLVLFRGEDDAASIQGDSLTQYLTPAENLVAGIYTKQKFLKDFAFEFEFAQSLYTRNTNLTESDSLKNDFLIAPFASLLSNRNASTAHSTAIDGSLGYGKEFFKVRLRFRQIDPDYQSMGAYFFQNDIRNITIEPSVTLLNSSLQINGSFGYQTDNVDNRRASTTKRKIGSAVVSGRIGDRYTGNLTYSNYDIGQAAGTVELDTLIEVSQTTQSMGMVHNLMFKGESLHHNIMASYNFQTLSDRNPNTAIYSEYENRTWMASYFLLFVSLRLNVTGSYTYTIFEMPSRKTVISGPTVSVSQSFFNHALNVSLSYASLAQAIDDAAHQTINRLMLNASYRPARRHRVSLRFYLNKTANEAENVKPFRETKGDIGYAYTF